jgi:hypothetical protein
VQSDGSFTIESVPPGTYQLFVQVKDISEGKTRYFTVNNQEVVAPDADGGQAGGTLDLGTVTLH